jgi:hypothetical protein
MSDVIHMFVRRCECNSQGTSYSDGYCSSFWLLCKRPCLHLLARFFFFIGGGGVDDRENDDDDGLWMDLEARVRRSDGRKGTLR